MAATTPAFHPKLSQRRELGIAEKVLFQTRLLLTKRYSELLTKKMDLFYFTGPPMLFFTFIILLYVVFPFFPGDSLEQYFVPIAFWIFVQKVVVTIMYEKSQKLQEAMRMMGLVDSAYWISYFISDGVVLGFIQAFTCSLLSTYGLFNHANFFVIFIFLYMFCLAAVPFSFFLCSFFDTPQTSGQATLLIMIGMFVIFIALDISAESEGLQVVACLFPPLALQLCTTAFQNSYTGLKIGSIIGIMFLDIFIYSFLAWYFAQIWPSKLGVPKPFYFVLLPSYWFPKSPLSKSVDSALDGGGIKIALTPSSPLQDGSSVEAGADRVVPEEKAPEHILGNPSIRLDRLRKSFASQTVVNDLSFNMYENQIFALLGHNGAGKTTTINMLTGLTSPDAHSDGGAYIYNNSLAHDMESIRKTLGVCPQHDVLFDNLTLKETILFFSQLKGFSYADALEEAEALPALFHLSGRLDHTGSELSGGQKRKLSVAIAICGGSKFIVLDEPTAGMDPMARRELWNLLSSLRSGRSILLTTHYMDEADVLGDRIGIMSLGSLQCIGTSQFLKTTFGAGYKVIFDKQSEFSSADLQSLVSFVVSSVPGAKHTLMDGAENQVIFEFPFDSVPHFGEFFNALEARLDSFRVASFGVTITSLEDVFLKVGEDHSVKPQVSDGSGIGNVAQFESSFHRQVIGIAQRRLSYAKNDFITIPLLLLPSAVAIITSVLYKNNIISNFAIVNDIITAAIYMAGYLGAPGLLAEFIVRERQDKLRNVLTVMGCDFLAYWVGTFIADLILMSFPLLAIFISWGAGDMSDFYSGTGGVSFFLLILFTFHMIAFSYICTFMFTEPKYCIAFMPMFIILLILAPNLLLLLVTVIFDFGLHLFTVPIGVQAGINLWGIMIMSPHGALFASLLDATFDSSEFISNFPPIGACIAFMIIETVIFFYATYYFDSQSVAKLKAENDPNFDESCLSNLDNDVQAERDEVCPRSAPVESDVESSSRNTSQPLRVERLRKVFPPKRKSGPSVIAAEDVCFAVKSGEIFGLLGANGAGKTTTLSMLTRHLVPTSGDAFVAGNSILSQFLEAGHHLGVVTQNNSLWDLLSVEDHLFLFARLRGVPTASVREVVRATIDQLELTPHTHKLAIRLSGGMKRKLCVAIALIGDPKVVLLDEPSAGLDPVSRRNLWSVILKTMSHRAVVLTTHSMEEAEALCTRIGIMVKGQLRALGTKQHLKSKFGSGYELVVKVKVINMESQTNQITVFVRSLFPDAAMISENGGLLTFRIPKSQMKMGLAFSALEANKCDLNIEDYSVAQPTLEQVFIRTVVEHSHDASASNPLLLQPRGSLISATVDENGELTRVDSSNVHDNDQVLSFKAPVNFCGCTDYFMKGLIAATLFLTLLFFGIAFGVSSPVCFALGVISLVSLIVILCIYCCPCCQPPKGVDE